ncbi:MAG: 50S ribosomal protein L5 [Candidatus Pacebacteria bacterium]|nr:50S ribosomal protein L5 [Candidatus Paceibacterota bacterium]
MIRLAEQYKKEVIPAMQEKFSYKSVMAIPKLKKIVVNSGFGKTITGKTGSERDKIIEQITESLALITGQKPVLQKAKKSISAFKLREGMLVGATVTLRGKRMYDFLEKLIWVVLPRIRDFRGLNPKAITKEGDLSIGFREYIPFPEVRMDKEKGVFGLEVAIVTTAKTKQEGEEFLRLIGLPIQHLNQ